MDRYSLIPDVTVAFLKPAKTAAAGREGTNFHGLVSWGYIIVLRAAKNLEIQKGSITTKKPYRTVKYKVLEGLTISFAEFCLRQMKIENKHFICN